MATEVWAKEVEGTGLTINIVNPGAGANTPGMAEEMREMSRDGAPRALSSPRKWSLRCSMSSRARPTTSTVVASTPTLGRRVTAGRSRPPRRPPRRLRTAPAAGLTDGAMVIRRGDRRRRPTTSVFSRSANWGSECQGETHETVPRLMSGLSLIASASSALASSRPPLRPSAPARRNAHTGRRNSRRTPS